MLDSDKCSGEKIKWAKGMKSWRWNTDVWRKSFPGRESNCTKALRWEEGPGLSVEQQDGGWQWSLEVRTLAFTLRETSH